ncbi:MAG TPA: FISUMP domain-containing protein, partial [Bacteroidales bacterium]|nr:FISUMP domain-containing protein [Bacteroidales bacterium]
MKPAKTIIPILFMLALGTQSLFLTAQAPQKISYQCVIRDASGGLVRSQTVGIRISILQGSAEGTAVYVETHTPETNVNGLATIEVGNGTLLTGTFSSLDWSNSPYFLKVETDPAGGNSYSIAGTSEIMSVPYALHAKTAESAETAQSVSPPSFQAPTATTLAATNVGSTSATLNGTVNANGFLSTVVFQWGTTTAYGNEISTTPVTGTGNESVSEDLSGLDYGETYHFRVKATNAIDITYGGDISFSTLTSLPQLTTSAVTSILSTTATSGGNITTDGGSAITVRGVCWNTSGDPTTADSKTSDGTGVGSFVSSITGLSTGTTYYVRSYATSGEGTAYGNEVSLRTFDGTVTDIDGNVYPTIDVGTQEWMAKDLETLHYNDGTSIPISGGENFPGLLNNYLGYVYTWYTLDTLSNEGKNVCPTGWHVPSDNEWTTFTDYLISNGYNYDGTTTGNKIAKSMATSTGWETSSVEGAVGNSDCPDKQNSSHFCGQSAGYRVSIPGGVVIRKGERWWCYTAYDTDSAWFRGLDSDSINLFLEYVHKNSVYSIRCINDNVISNGFPTVTTTSATEITTSSATSGGEVTSQGDSFVTARGICWNTSGDPTTADSKTTDGTGTGSFSSSLTGLIPNTTYYVRAYATNSAGTCYGDELEFTTNDHEYGSFIDSRDSHEYRTIEIGTQTWMAENLAYLPTVSPVATGSETVPYYYVYGYDGSDVIEAKATSNFEDYGVLYNWPAAMNGAVSSSGNPSGVQGVCPAGWHIPSDNEWKQLEIFIGISEENANSTGWRGTDQGTKLKTKSGWCCDGNGTDYYGFGALPSGYRHYAGNFLDLNSNGNWWTCTQHDESYSWYRNLSYLNTS